MSAGTESPTPVDQTGFRHGTVTWGAFRDISVEQVIEALGGELLLVGEPAYALPRALSSLRIKILRVSPAPGGHQWRTCPRPGVWYSQAADLPTQPKSLWLEGEITAFSARSTPEPQSLKEPVAARMLITATVAPGSKSGKHYHVWMQAAPNVAEDRGETIEQFPLL